MTVTTSGSRRGFNNPAATGWEKHDPVWFYSGIPGTLADEKIENHPDHRKEQDDNHPKKLAAARRGASQDTDNGDDIQHQDNQTKNKMDESHNLCHLPLSMAGGSEASQSQDTNDNQINRDNVIQQSWDYQYQDARN